MYNNSDLESMRNPLETAFAKQHRIMAIRLELEGLQTEFNQIIEFCKDKHIDSEHGYHIRNRRKEVRKVDPVKFATLFPEANMHLVQQHAAFMGSELDKLVQTKILPSINVKDAETVVGKTPLQQACDITVHVTTDVVQEND